MQLVRRWHLYMGLFTAPSVLFFAITGCFQLFNLHEAHGHYQPPTLIVKLASMHKDQVFTVPHDDHPDAAPAPISAASGQSTKAADDDDDDTPMSSRVLKWFFLLIALSLIASTLMGVWMGITHTRRKRIAWALLATGVLMPVVIALL